MGNKTVDHLHLHHLEVADYVVFVITLVVSVLIGVWYACSGGKQQTVQEYLVGNRQMGVIPIAMSSMATILSAMGVLTYPVEVYTYDAGLIYAGVGMCLALPVIVACYLPTFYELQLTSVFEYLELRFNSTLRKLGSLMSMCQLIIYSSLVLYAPSLAMSQVTGFSLWGTVITVSVLGTFYTSVGGIKGVIWTDVFQLTIVFSAMAVIVIKGVADVGGISYVFQRGVEGGRLKLSMALDFRVRQTIYSVIIASCIHWIGSLGVKQTLIQRYVSLPSLRKARQAAILLVIENIFFYILALITGLVIYAKYFNCDPLTTKMITAGDQLLPLFAIETLHMYPGLTGFFMASLFAASLSTISSTLNSLAAMGLEDFVKSFKRWRTLSSEKAAVVSKLLTVGFGMLCLALVPASTSLGTIIQSSYYNTNTFLGINFAVFTLGMFVPWANSFGASVGIGCGLVFALWVSVESQLHPQFTEKSSVSINGCIETFNDSSLLTYQPDIGQPKTGIFPLYQIAYEWIMALSALPVIIIGMIASALYKPTKIEDLNLKLLCPIVRKIITKYWLHEKKCDADHCSGIAQPDELNTLEQPV